MSKIINVRLATNAGVKFKNVADTTTLSQFYSDNGVNYARCSNTVNSVAVHTEDLSRTLGELSHGADEIHISSIVKQDCAAKIYIHTDTFEVKSSAKLEDWKKVLEYDPDFGIYDEDGNNIFAAMIDQSGFGSLTKNGVMWSDRAGADGYAAVSGLLPRGIKDPEEVKAQVTKQIGIHMPNLNALEDCVAEALEDAKKFEKEIADSIVMQ